MSLLKFNSVALVISIMIGLVSLMIFTFIAPHSAQASSQYPAYIMAATPTKGATPLTVVFTFPGGGFDKGGYWTLHYGDGQSDFMPVPADFSGTLEKTHVYKSAGTYKAKVIDDNYPDVEIPYANATITVSAPATGATLSASPTAGNAPLSVKFTGNGGGKSYFGGVWLEYGDGKKVLFCNPGSSCGTKSLSYTYATAGTYKAKLIGEGEGAASNLGTATIEVAKMSEPRTSTTLSVAQTGDKASLAVKATLGFNSTCQYYKLDWGDGNVEEKKAPSHSIMCGMAMTSLTRSHTYKNPGTYTITLDGTHTKKVTVPVVRHSDPIPPPSYSSDKDRAAQIDTLRKLLETLIQMINSTGGSQQVIPQGGSFILPVQSQPLSNPGTTNTTRSCLTLARSMDIGANDQMTGGEVSSLQQFLRGTGDFTYPEITGYYGQSTSQAVQKWQARNGVVTSGTPASTGFGRVGARTRTVMSSCR